MPKDIVYCVRCIYKLVASSYVVVMQHRFLMCRTYVAWRNILSEHWAAASAGHHKTHARRWCQIMLQPSRVTSLICVQTVTWTLLANYTWCCVIRSCVQQPSYMYYTRKWNVMTVWLLTNFAWRVYVTIYKARIAGTRQAFDGCEIDVTVTWSELTTIIHTLFERQMCGDRHIGRQRFVSTPTAHMLNEPASLGSDACSLLCSCGGTPCGAKTCVALNNKLLYRSLLLDHMVIALHIF